MAAEIEISLYRVAKRFPPRDKECLSPQAAGRQLPEGASVEAIRSWDALSMWDTEDGARAIGRQHPGAGKLIVRYDIPAGSAVLCMPKGQPGHYDVRGDTEELKSYLALDFKTEV